MISGMPTRQPRNVPNRSSLMTRQNSSIGASRRSCPAASIRRIVCATHAVRQSAAPRCGWPPARYFRPSHRVRIAIASCPASRAVCSPPPHRYRQPRHAHPRARTGSRWRGQYQPAAVMKATLPSSRAIRSPVSGSDPRVMSSMPLTVSGYIRPPIRSCTILIDRTCPNFAAASDEPGRAAIMRGQPFQPDRASLFVPMLDGAARHGDLIRTHCRIADEDQLVIRPYVRSTCQSAPPRHAAGDYASTAAHTGNCEK